MAGVKVLRASPYPAFEPREKVAMWIPVVSDSLTPGLTWRDEAALEAIIEAVPESLLEMISFVWVRDEPAVIEPGSLQVAFRPDAPPSDRLAALVSDQDYRVVLELYARNIVDSMSDDWLESHWGIRPCSLPMTVVDKAQVAVFGALLILAVRRGMEEEAKILVRRIGRVVFCAAVRCAIARLVTIGKGDSEPLSVESRIPAADFSAPPITKEEVARTDWDALFRQLLGMDTGEGTIEDRPGDGLDIA